MDPSSGDGKVPPAGIHDVDRIASGGLEGVLTVARSGGDFTSIHEAVEAAASRNPTAAAPWTILVYPGDYAIDRLIVPDHVSILGTHPQGCVLRASSSYGNRYPNNTLMIVPHSSEIANLTIHNTKANGGISRALYAGYDPAGETPGPTSGHSIRLRNLVLHGTLRDVATVEGGNHIRMEDCVVLSDQDIDTLNIRCTNDESDFTIRNCTIRSGAGAPLYIGGNGSATLTHCTIVDDSNRGGLRFEGRKPETEGTTIHLNQCVFLNGSTQQPGRMIAWNKGKDFTLYVNDCVYRNVGVLPGNGIVSVFVDGVSLEDSVAATKVDGVPVPPEMHPDDAPLYSIFRNSQNGGKLSYKRSDNEIQVLGE